LIEGAEEKLKGAAETLKETAISAKDAFVNTSVKAAEATSDAIDAVAQPWGTAKERVYGRVKEARDNAAREKELADKTQLPYREQARKLGSDMKVQQ
jgi:hypothetical protein